MAMVRRLVPEDGEALRMLRLEALRLHPEAFGSSHAEESARPVETFAEWTTRGYIAGGFVDGRLDAMAGLSVPGSAKQMHKGMLWGVYVRESRRGGGLAEAVMDAVLGHAGTQVEQVHLSVAATNVRAFRFYRRLGFEPYGVEPRALKVNGGYVDELLMVKVLDRRTGRPSPGGPQSSHAI
ncbi:GNAT family N-acetyltransferase [Azospirillum sp. YIM B02556]|uniref:GNAT family N-acetyltransferase n=2 Tax=Azospirillum endophyticum TaxID=2800326 RepID=A0ABS1F3T7_9PROT|nr:GNAT family N-acetyltransferase [Azospirillum endophyticum]